MNGGHAMEENIQNQILNVLQNTGTGIQIDEIGEKLGLTRHTVAKYLEILRAEGKIHYNKVGRTKLWKVLSAAVVTRLLGMDDLEEILRIADKIERENNSEKAERMASLKETAVYQLEYGDPLLNLGAEIDGKLTGFIFGEVKFWEFGLVRRRPNFLFQVAGFQYAGHAAFGERDMTGDSGRCVWNGRCPGFIFYVRPCRAF
jgi:DNA-binding Lrp family transcriptional regulator